MNINFRIKNFRAIQSQEVKLAPLTVLYGANGAGKSTLLYALLTLKNIILNPNQRTSNFFNYGFVNLGNYEAIVFDHKSKEKVSLEVRMDYEELTTSYSVTFDEREVVFALSLMDSTDILGKFQIETSFPYSLLESQRGSIPFRLADFYVSWNGITAEISSPTRELSEQAMVLANAMNAPIELLRTTQVVPLKRGFSKPQFSTVSLSPTLITEDELATFLSAKRYLVPQLSRYLEQIVGHDLRVNYQPGTSIFSLDSTDRETGLATELVNEGFGVNQIVHFLAICLNEDSRIVCVEEPEIHLHPTAVRKLARVLVEISRKQNKIFVISTHSEAFLFALLTMVADQKLKPGDLACYYAHKKGHVGEFEPQGVNDRGQVEGGLTSFLEGELEDFRTMFQITDLPPN